jgi:hypothetical protein
VSLGFENYYLGLQVHIDLNKLNHISGDTTKEYRYFTIQGAPMNPSIVCKMQENIILDPLKQRR